MVQRLPYTKISIVAYKNMLEMEEYIKSTNIELSLRELIKIRASQINGCAYCLSMHTQEAREAGESNQRIDCVSVWDECEFYTDKEKAALELTEAITNISIGGVIDDFYEKVRKYFDERDYVDLVYLINLINSWNRLSIAMKFRPLLGR